MAHNQSTIDTDLLIVGSGAGGLTAAVTGAAHNARVVVIEKSDMFGGTSATSGGAIWIPNGHLARAQGQQDSAEDGFRYIRALSAPNITDARIWAFVKEGPAMMEWMEKNSHVKYDSVPYSDYHAEMPGGRPGFRTHIPVSMDGRLLGPDLEIMRQMSPAASLGGIINWTLTETYTLLYRPPGWQWVLLKMLARYGLDIGQRLRSSHDRFLTMGNALLGRLKLSLNERGVPLWLKTRLVELTTENGRVTGAIVEREGERQTIRANRGVVLAAGGFERNAKMRAAYFPKSPEPRWSGSQINNVGEGIEAGIKAGGSVMNMDSAWWSPVFVVPGEERARMCTFERALPGCIIVNQAGRRYGNEAASYHIAGRAMVDEDKPDAGTIPSYIVFDGRFRWKYPMGPVFPIVPDRLLPRNVQKILFRGRTIEELARKIGMPPAALKETVTRFNDHARTGKDPDFGRGDHEYDRHYGDPSVKPNPCLAPLEKPPFYAVPIYPGDIGFNGGLATDEYARVLKADGTPIEGLYAIGNNAASVMGYSYPAAGATIGPAMTFGYIAAKHATGANA